MNNYQKAVEVPTIAPVREERGYLHTTRAGVAVPFSQSVITAFIVTAVFAALFFAFGWRRMEKVTLLIFVIALAFDWYVHRRHWFGLTKPEQPQVQIRSVDHDENPSTPEIIRIQFDRVDNGRYKQTSLFDLPVGITKGQMRELAVGLLEARRPWSIREWAGTGKTFSDPKWRELQSVMLRHQLLEPKSERGSQRGFQLTAEGVKTMEQFRAPSPTDEEA